MPTIKSYSGTVCRDGVIVAFSGINLNTDQTYRIAFSASSRNPDSSYELFPTGFLYKPSNKTSTVTTFFSASNPYTSYNSSSNIIKLSIFNSSEVEIYRDYSVVNCGNLSQDPILPSATPTLTPTATPTITKTPAITTTPSNTPTQTITPTPSVTPPLGMSASFPQFVTNVPRCGSNIVYGIAKGKLGQTYNYSFSTEMGKELEFSNPTGTITITNGDLTHNIYTAVTIKEKCLNYSIKFGISNGQKTVESIGFFVCGNCS